MRKKEIPALGNVRWEIEVDKRLDALEKRAGDLEKDGEFNELELSALLDSRYLQGRRVAALEDFVMVIKRSGKDRRVGGCICLTGGTGHHQKGCGIWIHGRRLGERRKVGERRKG